MHYWINPWQLRPFYTTNVVQSQIQTVTQSIVNTGVQIGVNQTAAPTNLGFWGGFRVYT